MQKSPGILEIACCCPGRDSILTPFLLHMFRPATPAIAAYRQASAGACAQSTSARLLRRLLAAQPVAVRHPRGLHPRLLCSAVCADSALAVAGLDGTRGIQRRSPRRLHPARAHLQGARSGQREQRYSACVNSRTALRCRRDGPGRCRLLGAISLASARSSAPDLGWRSLAGEVGADGASGWLVGPRALSFSSDRRCDVARKSILVQRSSVIGPAARAALCSPIGVYVRHVLVVNLMQVERLRRQDRRRLVRVHSHHFRSSAWTPVRLHVSESNAVWSHGRWTHQCDISSGGLVRN